MADGEAEALKAGREQAALRLSLSSSTMCTNKTPVLEIAKLALGLQCMAPSLLLSLSS